MNKGKFLAVCLIWLVIFGIGAAAWRLVVTPLSEARQAAEAERADAEAAHERARVLEQTTGKLWYDHEISLALDSFSGYAVLRSDAFSQSLRRAKIKLELVDDQADYRQRLDSLRSGKVQFAAFTIDALIKTTAEAGDREPQATIVALIDETRGADAMVAYKSVVRNVDDLNHADARFVLIPNSPSETLARVVMNTFALEQVAANPFIEARDPDDIFRRYQESPKNSRQVFVVWEPYVSRMLANPSMHLVIDSSRFTGYIVDCLVAERDFLSKQPELVQTVIECYFRALYEYRDEERMAGLVQADDASDPPLEAEMVRKVVRGIDWKNTQENFAHFGLQADQTVQHLADMIENITGVLVNTGAIAADPTGQDAGLLFDHRPLEKLFQVGFHPGEEAEVVDRDTPLPELSNEQWESLQEVGRIQVPALDFARGRDDLTEPSKRTLDDLVEQLLSWPQYYVMIRGNASLRGDIEANKRLAESRAQAAARYLTTHGVAQRRIRSLGGEPSGTTGVSFRLGQLPY